MGIGADLKKAREELGITLEAVSEKTKINVPFLEAIEREEWSIFPSQTFAKGFLRAYAKMVKVDTVLATRQFNEEVAPTAVVVSPPFNIESGPIQTTLRLPIPLPKKASPPPPVAPPVSVPPPAPTPAPPPAPVRKSQPQAEQRSTPPPKPASHLRPVSHPKPAPHVPPKDLALEFDEAKAAEERQAVARMLFTRPTKPASESGPKFILALKILLALLVLLSVALLARGIFRWAVSERDASSAVTENQPTPEPTEAPSPMKPLRRKLPPVVIKPVAPVRASMGPKPGLRPVVIAGQKPSPAVQPAAVLKYPVARPAVQASAQAPGSVRPVATSAPATNAVAPVSLSPAQAAAQAVAPVDKYHHLILKGIEASWVLVVVDGQTKNQFYLIPGQLKAFTAARGFAVKIGNASGVDAQYDGRSLGVLGGRGKVVEFVLPLGYQQAAQSAVQPPTQP